MRSKAMARSAWRAWWRDFGRAVNASLAACPEPDESGFVAWPLGEYCNPVNTRWGPVTRWVKRELRHGR